jgi:hypothetical protein
MLFRTVRAKPGSYPRAEVKKLTELVSRGGPS